MFDPFTPYDKKAVVCLYDLVAALAPARTGGEPNLLPHVIIHHLFARYTHLFFSCVFCCSVEARISLDSNAGTSNQPCLL